MLTDAKKVMQKFKKKETNGKSKGSRRRSATKVTRPIADRDCPGSPHEGLEGRNRALCNIHVFYDPFPATDVLFHF